MADFSAIQMRDSGFLVDCASAEAGIKSPKALEILQTLYKIYSAHGSSVSLRPGRDGGDQ
jgi:hypothetical protein